eukprot:scaffold603_cov404-Prasinococcus_capsulatus_cf.AAC.59
MPWLHSLPWRNPGTLPGLPEPGVRGMINYAEESRLNLPGSQLTACAKSRWGALVQGEAH